MPLKISTPTKITSIGNKTKIIEEFIGNVNSQTSEVSIAKMKAPPNWIEPGQRPMFDEYTIVLKGQLNVKTESGEIIAVKAGQALIAKKGEWVQYSTPDSTDTEYIAVCIPAFSQEIVNRDKY
ncbi:cupin domain-containing protein [Melioribacteraceae bacterium 4301-Me]|uniref:cupin domain-containing protein n=1 Tax=Pyranulibacter aquaticus TaxID=3163344 RepID=UPI00359C037B